MIHVVYDLTDCTLVDVPAEQIMTAMRRTADILGCTTRAQIIEPFQPHGATCVLILAESHIIVSTWPEDHLAHIDVFTCRANTTPDEAIRPVVEALGGRVTHTQQVARLVPSTQATRPQPSPKRALSPVLDPSHQARSVDGV
jgi:S-adenosylmethionine decarboxylase